MLKRLLWVVALLCAAVPCYAQNSTVIGSKVRDGSGNLLQLGQWCADSTCYVVTNGTIQGGATISQGAHTITVTNGAGVTYLTVPSVTITQFIFDWDRFILTSTASGIGVPDVACQLGASYTQTDNNNLTWNCVPNNGQAIWWDGQGAVGNNLGPGIFAGVGVPTFACTAPCAYIQSDASPQTNALWLLVAYRGTVSKNWVQQTGGNGNPSTAPVFQTNGVNNPNQSGLNIVTAPNSGLAVTVNGDTVTISAPGVVGATGATGATGLMGPPGATGATGGIGPPGATGATGAVGATGATGAQGLPGAPGATGAVGATGATGPAPTMSIGTVTTVACGSPATASFDGSSTPGHYVLNLDIPAGCGGTGSTGTTGSTGSTGTTGPIVLADEYNGSYYTLQTAYGRLYPVPGASATGAATSIGLQDSSGTCWQFALAYGRFAPPTQGGSCTASLTLIDSISGTSTLSYAGSRLQVTH